MSCQRKKAERLPLFPARITRYRDEQAPASITGMRGMCFRFIMFCGDQTLSLSPFLPLHGRFSDGGCRRMKNWWARKNCAHPCLELFYLQNFAHTIRMPDIKYPASTPTDRRLKSGFHSAFGITLLHASEASPVPTELLAVTVKV